MRGDTDHELGAELAATRRELRDLQQQLSLCRRELRDAQTLLATVAHEINNPLAYVQSNLCSLSRYADKIARYTGAVMAAESLFDRAADPEARRFYQRLRCLREQLKLDFVLEDLDPLVQQSLRGTLRMQRFVQALWEVSAAAAASAELTDPLDPAERGCRPAVALNRTLGRAAGGGSR